MEYDPGRPRPVQGMLAGILLAVAGLLALSMWLWVKADSGDAPDAYLFGLFAAAGALGGVLRSLGYLLAFTSFSKRDRKQWQVEAMTAPFLGAIAGLGVYLLVRASLVQGAAGVNRSGQYLLSLAAGMAVLGQVGKLVERGLLRGGANRSGILGGEISTAVPLLDRVERAVDERTMELTMVRYDGWVCATLDPAGDSRWTLTLWFDSYSEPKVGPYTQTQRVVTPGSDSGESAMFYVALISDEYRALPPLMPCLAPRSGVSEEITLVVSSLRSPGDGSDSSSPLASPDDFIALEVRQGTQTVQVLPLKFPDSFEK